MPGMLASMDIAFDILPDFEDGAQSSAAHPAHACGKSCTTVAVCMACASQGRRESSGTP